MKLHTLTGVLDTIFDVFIRKFKKCPETQSKVGMMQIVYDFGTINISCQGKQNVAFFYVLLPIIWLAIDNSIT